jgi:hypothetical protein
VTPELLPFVESHVLPLLKVRRRKKDIIKEIGHMT